MEILFLYIVGLVIVSFACGQDIQWLLYIGVAILGVSVIASIVKTIFLVKKVGK